MASLYDALEVHPQSSLDEIRRAYHRAARQHHPDKRVAPSTTDAVAESIDDAASQKPLPDNAADIAFLCIQEAYETLRDPARRAEYDAKLVRDTIVRKRDGEDAPVSAVVSAVDMAKEVVPAENDDEDDEVIYSHQCRCGDVYEVSEDELLDGVDVVPCNGCSFNIRVVMGAP
ncbi:Molecular chaperone [Globisporangium polare]